MKTPAIGRIVGLIFLIITAWIGIYFGIGAAQWRRDMIDAETAQPFSNEVDLSKPSQYAFPLHQTYVRSHSESFYLKTDFFIESDEKAVEIFKDLKAKISILNDKTGEKEIDEWDFPSYLRLDESDGLQMLSIHPFPKGDYTVKLTVLAGVPALEGKTQTLYCRYNLCGLEIQAIVVFIIIATVSGLAALITAISIAPGLVRFGFYKKTPTSSADSRISDGSSPPSGEPPTPHTPGGDSCTQNPGDTPRPDKTP